MRTLLDGVELTDKTPSALLRQMRTLAGKCHGPNAENLVVTKITATNP